MHPIVNEARQISSPMTKKRTIIYNWQICLFTKETNNLI